MNSEREGVITRVLSRKFLLGFTKSLGGGGGGGGNWNVWGGGGGEFPRTPHWIES